MRVVFFIVAYSIFINFFILPNRNWWALSFVIGRISALVEFSLFSFFFFKVIESRIFKRGILIVFPLMSAYLIYSLITSSNQSFGSVPSGLIATLFFIYCIFYLFEKVKDPASLFVYASPDFWVVVAIIIYSAGTFFLFISAQNNINNPAFEHEYKLIHSPLYIIRNILFCIAILIKSKTTKPAYLIKKR